MDARAMIAYAEETNRILAGALVEATTYENGFGNFVTKEEHEAVIPDGPAGDPDEFKAELRALSGVA